MNIDRTFTLRVSKSVAFVLSALVLNACSVAPEDSIAQEESALSGPPKNQLLDPTFGGDTPLPKTSTGTTQVTPTHQQSTGPDCYGADKYAPECALARQAEQNTFNGVVYGTPPAKIADLQSTQLDDNGLFLNPSFADQLDNFGHYRPLDISANCNSFRDLASVNRCTSQVHSWDSETAVQKDTPLLCAHDAFAAHLNWDGVPGNGVTYIANSYFDELAYDGDMNFHLVPANYAGVSAGDPAGIQIEYELSEIYEALHLPNVPVNTLMLGQNKGTVPTIVTGLFGVDAVHALHSELHPAWAIARKEVTNGQSELWATFVRNWGSEGECSSGNDWKILFRNGEYVLRLPWRQGAKSVSVQQLNVHTNLTRGITKIEQRPGIAVLVHYDMSTAPAQHPAISADLQLTWQ